MNTVIGDTLGIAIGIAISPLPIMAIIIILSSRQAVVNSSMFLAGWLLSLFLITFLVSQIDISNEGESVIGGWASLVFGCAFLFLAWKQWKDRPAEGETVDIPEWLASIETASSMESLKLGAGLAALHPKNVGLIIAGGTIIGSAGLSLSEQFIVVTIFIIVGSLSILIPVMAYKSNKEMTEPALDSLRRWLIQNTPAIMTVLFLVLGVNLLGEAMGTLG